MNSDVARFTTLEKNLATLFVAGQFRTWLVKRATSLFDLFCSNVAKQFTRFFVARFSVALVKSRYIPNIPRESTAEEILFERSILHDA